VHVNRILSLSGDLPVAVVIVDTPEKVDAFVPLVAGLVTDGLMTVEDLRAIGHAPGLEDSAAEPGSGSHGHPGMPRWLGHRASGAPPPADGQAPAVR
jgi:hypothetical protein